MWGGPEKDERNGIRMSDQ